MNYKKMIKEQYKNNYDYVLKNVEFCYDNISGMLSSLNSITKIKNETLRNELIKEQKRLKTIMNYCERKILKSNNLKK